MCRSRRELSNEYLLAKIGVDTAEITRPSKFGGKFKSSFIRLRKGQPPLGGWAPLHTGFAAVEPDAQTSTRYVRIYIFSNSEVERISF